MLQQYGRPLARIFFIGLLVVIAERIIGDAKNDHMKALRI